MIYSKQLSKSDSKIECPAQILTPFFERKSSYNNLRLFDLSRKKSSHLSVLQALIKVTHMAVSQMSLFKDSRGI